MALPRHRRHYGNEALLEMGRFAPPDAAMAPGDGRAGGRGSHLASLAPTIKAGEGQGLPQGRYARLKQAPRVRSNGFLLHPAPSFGGRSSVERSGVPAAGSLALYRFEGYWAGTTGAAGTSEPLVLVAREVTVCQDAHRAANVAPMPVFPISFARFRGSSQMAMGRSGKEPRPLCLRETWLRDEPEVAGHSSWVHPLSQRWRRRRPPEAFTESSEESEERGGGGGERREEGGREWS